MGTVMQTPDGEWVVEVYRQPRSSTFFYRLTHGENVVEGLSLGTVERLLSEAGYDLAEPRRGPGARRRGRAPGRRDGLAAYPCEIRDGEHR